MVAPQGGVNKHITKRSASNSSFYTDDATTKQFTSSFYSKWKTNNISNCKVQYRVTNLESPLIHVIMPCAFLLTGYVLYIDNIKGTKYKACSRFQQ